MGDAVLCSALFETAQGSVCSVRQVKQGIHHLLAAKRSVHYTPVGELW